MAQCLQRGLRLSRSTTQNVVCHRLSLNARSRAVCVRAAGKDDVLLRRCVVLQMCAIFQTKVIPAMHASRATGMRARAQAGVERKQRVALAARRALRPRVTPACRH